MEARASHPFSLLLVGFQDQDNLGLRYLVSAVRQAGFAARIVTYQSNPAPLVELVLRERPDVIGFSLIFQYMAPDFGRVIQALRDAGVTAHITMGGHYPSFDYGEVLQRIPGLDSIVRFEGEPTLVELLARLAAGGDWRAVQGLAFRTDGEVVATPLRPSVRDLDTLPWPDREDIDYAAHDLPTASVLGSRGCPWDCSFCSIRPFYEAQEGPLRRMRRPEAVVEEMAALYHDRGVPVFLFQDDDFLAGGKRARQWACDVADGLIRAGLQGKVAFKMSCRSGRDPRRLHAPAHGGRAHARLHGRRKRRSPGPPQHEQTDQARAASPAGRILRDLGLSFDFGFMLLDPYSTFDMVRNNIDFLDEFVGDGWAAASFCRMLPYAGTPVKAKLESEGRLLGTPFEPDYRFLDPKLDIFYDWMLETFHQRNFTSRGLCHILKSLLFEARLRLPGHQRFTDLDRAYVKHLNAVSNGLALYTLRAAMRHIEATPLAALERDRSFLQQLTRHEETEEDQLLRQVVDFYWSVRQRPSSPAASPAEAELADGRRLREGLDPRRERRLLKRPTGAPG